jgi:hypothetical protein
MNRVAMSGLDKSQIFVLSQHRDMMFIQANSELILDDVLQHAVSHSFSCH